MWWLAQALTALDRMTPNAFTGRAGQMRATPIELTRGTDEPGGCSKGLEAGGWCVAKGKRLPCPLAESAGVYDSVDRGTRVWVSER